MVAFFDMTNLVRHPTGSSVCVQSTRAIYVQALILADASVQVLCQGGDLQTPRLLLKGSSLVLWVPNQYMLGKTKALSIVRLSKCTFGRFFLLGTIFHVWIFNKISSSGNYAYIRSSKWTQRLDLKAESLSA